MGKTWKVVLAFVGIFVAGLIVGGLLTLGTMRYLAMANQQFGPQLIKHITEKLDLTAEQKEKITPIIAQGAEELRLMRRTAWTNTQAVIERMDGEIAAQLTPEQKAKFDQMLADQRERVKRFLEERTRRRPGGPDAPAPH
jgi:Spy/CpxP family protein refolding chaperone